MKKLLIIAGTTILIFVAFLYFVYPYLDGKYQRAMDPIRRSHTQRISDVIREFADKTGNLPFQEQATDRPFMVLIGHSPEHEAHFANDPVLNRGVRWANSSRLESMLESELGRDLQLPRDPQKVPSYAPNVYIYFVSGNQMSIISHLNYPSENAVQYEWNGTPFYAYTITYEFDAPDKAAQQNDASEPRSLGDQG